MKHCYISILNAIMTISLTAIVSPAVLAADEIPKGWWKTGLNPESYQITIDRSTKRSGKAAARIESNSDAAKESFGNLMSAAKADAYRGKRIRLTGWMKTEGAVSAQIFLRLDTATRTLGFDNMGPRPVKGTTGWTKYELVLDVPEETVLIVFGFFVSENGKAWADDFQLDVVGKEMPATNILSAEDMKREIPPRVWKSEYPMQPFNLDFEN